METRIASLHEGLQLQKRDYEEKLKDLRQQIQNEQLNVRVAEQKIRDLQEQLNLANDRAFDAESRLGRMQKAHATIVAERNRSQYSTKAAATAKAAADDAALAKDLEEIDMLGSELLNVDVRSFYFMAGKSPPARLLTTNKIDFSAAQDRKSVV